MVPTTVATGRSAGTNVAATGRTRLAIGRALFTAGRAFLVNQLLECASEEKEGVVFISKRVILYYHIITFMLIQPKYTLLIVLIVYIITGIKLILF
jgi:hypothetical protein